MQAQPILKPRPTLNHYELVEDYTYGCNIDGEHYDIAIPAGFTYNGASIPAFGWTATYTPFHPDVMVPALVHDWLYGADRSLGMDRYTVDSVFYQMLVDNGVNKAVAEIMYTAVRVGGSAHWRV